MSDPVAMADAAQDALDRFGEVTIFAEFGNGWTCTHSAGTGGASSTRRPDDRGGEA